MLKCIRKQIYTIDAKNPYYTLVYPYLSYAVEVWGAAKKVSLKEYRDCTETRCSLYRVSPLYGGYVRHPSSNSCILLN